MFKNSLLIPCHQQCNWHHLSQQVCPDVGSQSEVQQQSTKQEGVMIDESFQLPVFKTPVSGEPLKALESLSLSRSLEKLNYAQLLHAYVAFLVQP